jgi:hypothetical protein
MEELPFILIACKEYPHECLAGRGGGLNPDLPCNSLKH